MYSDILLAIDLGQPETQAKAVEAAVKMCETFSSRLHVITVVPDYGMSIVGSYFSKDHEAQALKKAGDALHAYVAEHIPSAIPVQHIVGHGAIYREILAHAGKAGCDLIVMASHHPDLEDYLIGPNAEKVMRHADCSVLVVRD